MHYSDEIKDTIRRLADAGVPWEEIGRATGRSATAVETAARRFRVRGDWPEDPDSVREYPSGGPGRPRNRSRSTSVSVRFSPSVAEALRELRDQARY